MYFASTDVLIHGGFVLFPEMPSLKISRFFRCAPKRVMIKDEKFKYLPDLETPLLNLYPIQ